MENPQENKSIFKFNIEKHPYQPVSNTINFKIKFDGMDVIGQYHKKKEDSHNNEGMIEVPNNGFTLNRDNWNKFIEYLNKSNVKFEKRKSGIYEFIYIDPAYFDLEGLH